MSAKFPRGGGGGGGGGAGPFLAQSLLKIFLKSLILKKILKFFLKT